MSKYFIFGLFVGLIFFLGCDKIGHPFGLGLKNSDMTDEDFVKITVRSEHTVMDIPKANIDKPMLSFEDMIKRPIEIKTKICKKYGYSFNAYLEKEVWVRSHFESEWIQRNIMILGGIADGMVTLTTQTNKLKTDDDWDEFFIENGKYLKK